MISLKGVSKSYKCITIFEEVNITFMPNKWNFIEGVNGSGKSVLLKLICGFSTVSYTHLTLPTNSLV